MKENIDSEKINNFWNAYHNEASALYQQLLTVMTAFLGGSLIFLEKIAPNPRTNSWMLFIGWLALIIGITLLIIIRRINLLTIEYAISEVVEEKKKGKKLEIWNSNLMTVLFIVFILGILFITLFGAVNLGNDHLKYSCIK